VIALLDILMIKTIINVLFVQLIALPVTENLIVLIASIIEQFRHIAFVKINILKIKTKTA
jgi:hypothetical protein